MEKKKEDGLTGNAKTEFSIKIIIFLMLLGVTDPRITQ